MVGVGVWGRRDAVGRLWPRGWLLLPGKTGGYRFRQEPRSLPLHFLQQGPLRTGKQK